jgi:hypothetical protein
MILESSTDRINQFWASELGCLAEDLSLNKVTVHSKASKEGLEFVSLFHCNEFCHISCSELFYAIMEETAQGHEHKTIFDTNFLIQTLGSRIEKIIGPAYLGYADASNFKPAPNQNVRLLDEKDEPLFINFTQDLDPLDCNQLRPKGRQLLSFQ